MAERISMWRLAGGKDLLDSNHQSVLPTPSPGGTESQDEGKPGGEVWNISETPRKALV
tara:strand:- start:183 stop:356 length:174 start_codon:yes stop_codon:yes gene_type:complete